MSEPTFYGYGIVDKDGNVVVNVGVSKKDRAFIKRVCAINNKTEFLAKPYRVVQLFWKEIQDSKTIPPQASQSSGTGTGTADK